MTSSNSRSIFTLLRSLFKYLFILVVAIYLIVWVVSPFAARHFAEQPLQELGVSLGDDSSIRYNPFTSTLTVNELSLLNSDKQEVLWIDAAEVSVHLHRLLFKQLYVSEFTLEETRLAIDKSGDSLFVSGIDLSPSTENKTDVETEPDNQEPAPDFTVIVPNLDIIEFVANANIDGVSQSLTLKAFSLEEVLINQADQDMSLSISAKLNEAPLKVDVSLSMVSGVGEIDSEISLDGLDLTEISPLLAEFGVDVAGLFTFKANPKVLVNADELSLDIGQATISLNELSLQYDAWVVEGKTDVVTLDNLKVQASSAGEIKHLSTKVRSEFSQGNIGLDSSENSVVNWGLVDLTADVELVDMQPKVAVSNINVELLNLSQDHTLEAVSPIVSLQRLGISDVQFADNFLSIDTISIDGLKTDIKINPDKSIVSLVDTSSLSADETDNSEQDTAKESTQPAQPEDPVAQQSEAQAMGIALNKFIVNDQATILVNDQSVSPAFEQNITIETLQAGPFDSRNPKLESPFELIAKDQNYLKINVSGVVSPFGEKLNAATVSKINEMSLPSISPYLKDALGFEMKSGQLDVTVDVKIVEDQIDGDTSLFMRGIEMVSADEVEQGTIKEGKAMPLNIALGMLKDDQGNIELDVPLRGDVADPSFGIESFLALVLKKAAMSQAKDYLMTTFVPYASVVSVAISGAEYLLKVKFEPLVFSAGEVLLTDEQQQYLSELVLLMQDKTELQLKTCAVSNYQDLSIASETAMSKELQAKLKALGDERQSNLKGYLIEQGIPSSRILYCAPELDTADDAQPRIELKTD